jgi:hypothetical protein
VLLNGKEWNFSVPLNTAFVPRRLIMNAYTSHIEGCSEFDGNEEFAGNNQREDGESLLSELILTDSGHKTVSCEDGDETPFELFPEIDLLSELLEVTDITTVTSDLESSEGDPSISFGYPSGEQFPVLSLINASKKTINKFEWFATFDGAITKLTMHRYDPAAGANHSSWQFLIWDANTLDQAVQHCQKVAAELKLNLIVNKQAILSRLATVVGPQRRATPAKTVSVTTPVKPAKPQAKVNPPKHAAKRVQPVVAKPVAAPTKPMYIVGEDVVGRVTQFKDFGVIITGNKGEGILKYSEGNGSKKGGVDHGSLLVNEGDEINVRVTEVRQNGFAKFTFRSLPDAELHFLSCLVAGKQYDGVIEGCSKYGFHINVGGPVTLFLSKKEVPAQQVTSLRVNQKVQVRFIWLNKEKRIPHVSMLDSSNAQPASSGDKAA